MMRNVTLGYGWTEVTQVAYFYHQWTMTAARLLDR